MFKNLLVASAIMTASIGGAHAASVSIDTFDTTNFQVVGAPTLGGSPQNPATTSGPTSDAIGGVRTLTAERTFPAGTDNAFGAQVQIVVTDGSTSVSLGNGIDGTAMFDWDAGGADLVDGTNSRIILDILSFDQPGIEFLLSIGGVTVSNTVSALGELSFDFADFGGADFTNVGGINLLITGPTAYDVGFDNVRAAGPEISNVPLPAGGLLLLGGFGILGAWRTRRSS